MFRAIFRFLFRKKKIKYFLISSPRQKEDEQYGC